MKKIFYLLSFIAFFSCKAQIVDLDSYYTIQQGYYYKDLNHILNNFEGTYLYQNGNDLFTITLQKKENSTNGYYYEDMLIGGYRIVTDGIEIVNTLPLLNNFYTDGLSYSIWGNNILTGNTLRCTDCGVNEKWINASIEDPISDSHDTLFIRKINVSGQEAIKIWIYHEIPMTTVGESVLQGPISYPLGDEIILLKQ